MRNQLKKDPLGQAIKKCLTVGGVSMAVLLSAGSAVADECDIIYGVHDDKLNDSQFVTIDSVTYEVQPLGPMHEGKDFEGLDINSDGDLIASSGDDVADDVVDNVGVLSKINTNTGDIEERLGQVCFSVKGQQVCGTEISALSFHPAGGLFAWSEECGLIDVDMANPANSTLVLPYATDGFKACLSGDIKAWQKYTSHVEDIAWDHTGKYLFVANGGNIDVYIYKVSEVDGEGTFEWFKNYAVGGNIETVEMLQDNHTLLLKVHNSRTLRTLDLKTGDLKTVNGDIAPYTDIEAVAACIPKDNIADPFCVMDDTDWMYVKDAFGDATGFDKLEIHGIALKQEGDTITVAISANMSPDDPLMYKGENVNFTDFVFDFAGTKYAVHFAPDNDSDATELGLYANVTLKDVTKKNHGWSSFKSYNRGDLGDLPIHNDYFSWKAVRSVPQEIASGDKVANDNFSPLTQAELAGMGLNFPTGLNENARELGEYTFGFSFTKTEDMTGEFIAYVFTECINDGIAMVTSLPSCPGEEAQQPQGDWTAGEGANGGSTEPELTRDDLNQAVADAQAQLEQATDGNATDENTTDDAIDRQSEALEDQLDELKNITDEIALQLNPGEADQIIEAVEQAQDNASKLKTARKLLKTLKQAKNNDKKLAKAKKLNKAKNQAASVVDKLTKAKEYADAISADQVKTLITEALTQLQPISGASDLDQAKQQADGIGDKLDKAIAAVKAFIKNKGEQASGNTPSEDKDSTDNGDKDNVDTTSPTPNSQSALDSVEIAISDEDKYQVSLVSHEDNTWTYRVQENSGKDLSHFVLGVGNCAKVVNNNEPSNTTYGGHGRDGSTGFYGIKWDTSGGFSNDQFSFTLDASYPEGEIEALAKAGSKKSGAGHAKGKIIGPDCSPR
ncbi:MAG TPA: hypothetical protein ENI48_05740 [Thioploca sp.]|nr:hypothetical protein [Thioploca sp.]